MEYSDKKQAKLHINLEAIVSNYRRLASEFSGDVCAAVVKANAYGLGARFVAPKLRDAGCGHFFVASLDEALDLRLMIGKEPLIYVFHGIQALEEEYFVQHDLIPVINHAEQLQCWQACAKLHNTVLPAVFHIDTGMNRLGFDPSTDFSAMDISGIDVRAVMSHLACADVPEHSLNDEQRQKLLAISLNYFPNTPVSLVNSYGVFLPKDYHFHMARPGMALYGLNPVPKEANPMENVVSLKVPILQLRDVDTHGTVGYGATSSVAPGVTLATVPLGYADGYFRCLGSKGEGHIEGFRVQMVGRVSMDLITFDVSSVPSEILQKTSHIDIIGKHQSVDKLASMAGTIGYEFLTRLGSRYHRIYGG